MEAVCRANMRVAGVVLLCLLYGSRSQETSSTVEIETTSQIPVTTTHIKPLPPQAKGFYSEATEISSGPIIFVDKYTVFISTLTFPHPKNNTYFCANRSSSEIVTLTEAAKYSSISNGYYRNIVELTFPENVSSDSVEDFGICEGDNFLVSINLGEKINKTEIIDLGYDSRLSERNEFRVPKCCNERKEFDEEMKCEKDTNGMEISGITVFQSNRTHINLNESVENPNFVPYIYPVKCADDEMSLVGGNLSSLYGIIYNTSLLMKNIAHLISPGSYCVDRKGDEIIVIVCLPVHNRAAAASFTTNLYLILLIISTICFALAAFCYWSVLSSKSFQQHHKSYFVGYSGSMCLTFLMLILLHILNKKETCYVLGSIFLLFTVVSYACLTILCVDLTIIVYYYQDGERYARKRFYWYMGASIGFSILWLVISLCVPPAGVPDVPSGFIKNSGSSCDFSGSRLVIFYLPVGIMIFTSLCSLIATKVFIMRNEEKTDVLWDMGKTHFKFMHRSYIIAFAIVFLWFIEVIFATLVSNIESIAALDLLEASLGIINFVIFVTNKHSCQELLKILNKRKRRPVTEYQLKVHDLATPASPDEHKFLFPENGP